MAVARKAAEVQIGGRTWEELWPQVEDHLHRVLRFRIPPEVDRADVIQETAARLFASRGASLTTEVEVFQYSTRIAMNLAIDLTRRSGLVAFQPIVGDLPSGQDVESEVVARAELTAVCRDAAAARIDLTALTADVADTPAASSALKSRRYRARKRLSRWSDRLAGGVLLPRLRWLLGGMAATATLAPAFVPGIIQAPFQMPNQGKQIPAAAQRLVPAVASAAPFASAGAASQGMRSGGHAPPAQPDPPVYRAAVEVSGPAWTGADAGEREYPPDAEPEHLACARRFSPLPDTCLPHPLR